MADFTLWCGFQQVVANTFWNEPPLENWVVGSSCAQYPLEVMGPADIRDMCRMAYVFSKFGSCKYNFWED